MESFLYTNRRKNAAIAGAMFSKIVLVLLAFYAGAIDQCRDFCASHEQDAGGILVQYTLFFSTGTMVVVVFSWLIVCFWVHESSSTTTAEECEIHDQNLTENENIQYIIISNIVEMLALGIYGVANLVIVADKCSDRLVSGSLCHTTTWVLTVCSFAWALAVGVLYYNNRVPTDMVKITDYAHTGGYEIRIY